MATGMATISCALVVATFRPGHVGRQAPTNPVFVMMSGYQADCNRNWFSAWTSNMDHGYWAMGVMGDLRAHGAEQ